MANVIDKPSDSPAKPGIDLEGWLQSVTQGRSATDESLIRRATQTAREAHLPQLRASGEPYIQHAVAVADILAGLRLDTETLAAAVLHDVVEDTHITLAQLEEQFGPGVARLVDGVTKLKLIHEYQNLPAEARTEHTQAENLRKMLLAMAEDVRVVLIKLADRLHNMRTLKHLPEDKRRRIARETLDIYAPLANRLGIWQMKWELEDLSFRYLEPDTYHQVASLLDERRSNREGFIEAVIEQLRAVLADAGISADISGRPKHIYSIWRKMQRKGLDFHQLFDVRAVRILVKDVATCYTALGVVHNMWTPIPREFDDYIARPKDNHYQSLHTAVLGPDGKTLEIQIRTEDMHQHAELGVAAHWRYKEGARHDAGFERKIAWLRQMLEWKEEEANAGDFIDRFKNEAFQDRVYVFTPMGKVIDLPQGATPLDFAYHVHTDVGHHCRGARVDGNIVPLTQELKSGQQVDIITARNGAPSRDWLNPHLGYIKTSRARAKAKQWFKQQDHDKNVAAGRTALERELHRLGIGELNLEKLAQRFSFKDTNEFLAAVGRGDINTSQIANATQEQEPARLLPTRGPDLHPPTPGGGGDISIVGVGNLLTHMAGCCKPVPPEPIVGYITRGRGVTIHRRDCPNAERLDSDGEDRLIEVDWSAGANRTYPVEIVIQALDRQGLLRDVSAVLANDKTNVLAVNTLTDKKQNIATMALTVEIGDIGELSRILDKLGQLPNVIEARRRT